MRGQAIAEYTLLIATALTLTGVFIAIAANQAGKISANRQEASVKTQLDLVQTELIAAALAHDGYRYGLTIEPINGIAMTVWINDTTVKVNSSGYENTIQIPPVNGTVRLTRGTVSITKDNGTVNIA